LSKSEEHGEFAKQTPDWREDENDLLNGDLAFRFYFFQNAGRKYKIIV